LKNNEDNISLFGESLKGNREDILKRIGSLIEAPALYHHLTGFANLKARAIIFGVTEERIREILAIVGLTDAASKKAGKYSLGMKQRLGIGLALLSDPELLILDEPTNGLDPNGIIEIRKLIQKLATEFGKTIFISSHLLAEIERIATHVGILYHGKLSFEGKIGDLQGIKTADILIETDRNDAAKELLAADYTVIQQGNVLKVAYQSQEQIASIVSALVHHKINVYSIYKEKKDLESLFLDITQTA
jgi:ABC-2 type transport system ATP-binding protein